ncbi:hypothetical protein ACI0FP_17720, partial [Bacillus velezensis]
FVNSLVTAMVRFPKTSCIAVNVSFNHDGQHFLVEEWENQTFRFYCRQYEAAEKKVLSKEAQNGMAQT